MEERQAKKAGIGPAAWMLGLIVVVGGVFFAQLFSGNAGCKIEDPAVAQAAQQANGQAGQLLAQHKVGEAEKLLEPFVNKCGPSADACKQTLAAIYAIDGRIADVERVCRALAGGGDAATADKIHFLGAPMANMNPKAARPVLERSAAMYKQLYGADSKQYVKDMYNVAFCDYGLGNFDAAAKEMRAVVPAAEKAFGPNDQLTQAARAVLSECEGRAKRI